MRCVGGMLIQNAAKSGLRRGEEVAIKWLGSQLMKFLVFQLTVGRPPRLATVPVHNGCLPASNSAAARAANPPRFPPFSSSPHQGVPYPSLLSYPAETLYLLCTNSKPHGKP